MLPLSDDSCVFMNRVTGHLIGLVSVDVTTQKASIKCYGCFIIFNSFNFRFYTDCMHIYVVCEKVIFSDTSVSQSFYHSVCLLTGEGMGSFQNISKE